MLPAPLAPPAMTTNERKLYNAIKGKYSRLRSGFSFVWSELPHKLQSRQAFNCNSIYFIFPWYSFSTSMHRRHDVRPSISKCRQVATTGQLCGGLPGMCGVSAFGHTKKCFSASRNWCKVSRYCVYASLLLITTARIKVANINGSLTGWAEMEQAPALCSHFAKTERPLFLSYFDKPPFNRLNCG